MYVFKVMFFKFVRSLLKKVWYCFELEKVYYWEFDYIKNKLFIIVM